VKVGEQIGYLLVRESAGEWRHHAFAGKNGALDVGIGCGRAAGQLGMVEDTVQIGRDFFERQVVEFVAVGAAPIEEMLPFCLLGSKRRPGVAGSDTKDCRQ